ncbi:alpha/beta hydrolase [Nonomuraea sediminis]|uniref:alpha/beta hydrolase n=1 Tax=Nonomuraea sediminis TaxID=2835864 RepID=UPI001BDBCC43|nr:alpha/beta hydrolase [Nonomuraea sediminis]
MRILSTLLALVLAATPLRAAPVPQGLTWSACAGGMECAALTVPIDWNRPHGGQTRVDLARFPARDPAHKLGSLVVNTGGGATIQVVRTNPATVSELTRWFDVVLIDPRGMGDQGSPAFIECALAPPGLTGLILHPDERSWQEHASRRAAADRSCRQAMGPAYAGLTAWQVAHDLEALRVALGEPKLRYLGNSYGTVYGQAYLELFPGKVGRMVLDGVADHTRPSLERWLLDNALTEERQLAHFNDWLPGHDAIRMFDDLLARTRRAPLPAGGRTVNEREFLVAVREALAPPRWPALAAALRQANDGDASKLAALLPQDPQPPGYATESLLCHDFMPRVPGYREFRAIESRLRTAAPRIGRIQGRYQLARCIGLGDDGPAYPPHPLRARGVPPVLISIGDNDDNTPNLAAEHLAAQLPNASVIRHGDGHAAYVMQGVAGLGETCLRGYVHAYLRTGALPPAQARCPGDLVARIPRG